MLEKIFSPRISNALNQINPRTINEIRLRVNRPIEVLTSKYYYLNKEGLTTQSKDAIVCLSSDLSDAVFNACNHSVFSHNEEIKQGFLTIETGMRLGLAGEIVVDNGEVSTIKNISSINLRFAKEVKNCSLNALRFLCDDDKFCSTLVISPPNCGKTTFIRDLSYQLSTRQIEKNILIIDERNEISASINGIPSLNIGENVDVYVGCSKQFGIINGIRTMSPDLIIVDEIITNEDFEALKFAFGSGVKIIATVHSLDYNSVLSKYLFKNTEINKLFDRFVVLSKENGFGTVDSIFNGKGICIYCGG